MRTCMWIRLHLRVFCRQRKVFVFVSYVYSCVCVSSQRTVASGPRTKNLRLLKLTNSFTRYVHGGRVTSCKVGDASLRLHSSCSLQLQLK